MGIKPIDVQVNISQINHVARMQHNEQGHHREVQLQQGQHVLREADATAHSIQQTHQPENEESVVKEKAEQERRESKGRNDSEKEQHAEEEDAIPDPLEEKGQLFDGFS